MWNIIAIIIALSFLHKDFDIITSSLLEVGDKSINSIQSILQFKKTKNITK